MRAARQPERVSTLGLRQVRPLVRKVVLEVAWQQLPRSMSRKSLKKHCKSLPFFLADKRCAQVAGAGASLRTYKMHLEEHLDSEHRGVILDSSRKLVGSMKPVEGASRRAVRRQYLLLVAREDRL